LGDSLQLDAIIYTAITRSRENLIVLNSHPRYSEFGKSLPSKWNEQ
jgi:ATP-dependent exoDNAse (exonuclease V) alpha subunit